MFPVQVPPPPVAVQQPKPQSKTPVVRGARACSVCRVAKMKCVGGEEGVKPCQRCKRSGAECIFEKHRRGRKPGSKLSDASRNLRHLEKGLGDAKLKAGTLQSPHEDMDSTSERFPNNKLPPLNISPDLEQGHSHTLTVAPPRPVTQVEERQEDSFGRRDRGIYPVQLIKKESERTSFFSTILNPEPSNSAVQPSNSLIHAPPPSPRVEPTSHATSPPVDPIFADLRDPVAAGIVSEAEVTDLFNQFFRRLNPFVNIFDPALHTVSYIRSHCPFLFTTIIAVSCKFFKPDLYPQSQKLAQLFALRAFAENWRGVEVVQAFATQTFWKEPEDARTWTYIGYACRMAVELGLNRHVGKRSPGESEVQFHERRNRERTYLMLFVHDRTLSAQTGRQWMLVEDDFIRRSVSWHTDGVSPVRPEDVIVSAFVQLQRITSETIEAFNQHSETPGARLGDAGHESLLSTCNGKLTQWLDTWQHEMRRASGQAFHFSFLNLFRAHYRLFLNSFGVQAAMCSANRSEPSRQALLACYSSALEVLKIITKEFAEMSTLRFAQDNITLMTAYASVFLLKMIRSSNTRSELHETATSDIHKTIKEAAETYQGISSLSPVLTSAAHHARFLRNLVEMDVLRMKQAGNEGHPIHGSPEFDRKSIFSPSTADTSSYQYSSRHIQLPPILAPPFPASTGGREAEYRTTSPVRPGTSNPYGYPSPSPSNSGPTLRTPQQPPSSPATNESDANYWRNMCRELGLGDELELMYPSNSTLVGTGQVSNPFGSGGLAGCGPSYSMRTYPPPPPSTNWS